MYSDDNGRATLCDFSNCVKRWLAKAPNVTKGPLAPFTPTGDINDALFTIHRSPEDDARQHVYEPFDCSAPDSYYTVAPSGLNVSFTSEQADEYFARLIAKTRPSNDVETEIENNRVTWYLESNDHLAIGDELKKPEEIRQLEERDDLKRVWKKTRGAEAFIQQKIKNMREFQALCARFQ